MCFGSYQVTTLELGHYLCCVYICGIIGEFVNSGLANEVYTESMTAGKAGGLCE